MKNSTSFGEVLRYLRVRSQKTLKELAEAMECSSVYISDIERNRRNPPSASDIEKLASCLNVETRILLDAADKQRKHVELNIDSNNEVVIDAALMLARRWTDLTGEEAQEIIDLLKKDRG